MCVSLLCLSHKHTLTKLNFCPPLSIIEKQIKATFLLHGWRKIQIFPRSKLLWGSTHHTSITTASGVWVHSVNRQSRAECSQVVCRSYLSRCKGYREFGFWVRCGGRGMAKSQEKLVTQSGRLDLLKAALQTQNVINWFTYHPYVTYHSKCDLALRHTPRVCLNVFMQSLFRSACRLVLLTSVNPGVAGLVANLSSSSEHRAAINLTPTHARQYKEKLTLCMEEVMTEQAVKFQNSFWNLIHEQS